MASGGAVEINPDWHFGVGRDGVQDLALPTGVPCPGMQGSRKSQTGSPEKGQNYASAPVSRFESNPPSITNKMANSELREISAASDELLVERSLRGEEEAFRLLYERYRQPVFSIVRRILRDGAEAQDATQEVFIKVYRALSTWSPSRAKFSTWIYRLAANHAIDCWRLRRRRAEIGLADAEWAAELHSRDGAGSGAEASHPGRTLEDKETVAEIQRCLVNLSYTQRRIFVLRHVQGLKLREISAREGYSLGTIKGSLHRAIRMLRQRLQMPVGFMQKDLKLLAESTKLCEAHH